MTMPGNGSLATTERSGTGHALASQLFHYAADAERIVAAPAASAVHDECGRLSAEAVQYVSRP